MSPNTDGGSEGQDGAASAAPERPGCSECVGELPAPTVGLGTQRSHPKTEGNPRSDPSEFPWEFIQSVHRNNKVQLAGLNPPAFSCPGACPAPQGHKRRGFFPFLPPALFPGAQTQKPCCLIKPGRLQDCQFQRRILHGATPCLTCSSCFLHHSRRAFAFRTLYLT